MQCCKPVVGLGSTCQGGAAAECHTGSRLQHARVPLHAVEELTTSNGMNSGELELDRSAPNSMPTRGVLMVVRLEARLGG